MRKFHSNSMKALAFSASAIAFVMAGPVSAQEEETDPPEEEEEQVDITDDGESSTEEEGRITVTGSRIVRDTYSSISPLQVISGVQQREVGAFDPSQILQRSTAAAGQQIDATFQGFVLDNGPGSATLNLRGLGANRNLLLLNGRRLAPSGVEGAPQAPSLNLIPGSLVDRFEIVTDGASSVYGSDAVAGVVNVILRKDYDGLELFARGEINPQGAGEDYTVSAAWGTNSDRGFFGIGAEYDFRDQIRIRDRDFFAGCRTEREVTQDGRILTQSINQQANALAQSGGTITTPTNQCAQVGFSGRVFIPFTGIGSVYFNEGQTNVGIPGFNESFFDGGPVDGNGDGIRDVDLQGAQNLNGLQEQQDATFLSQQELINVLAYGEYTFPGEANITPFFEALYSRAEITADTEFIGQVFPFVPDDNPFNPCNPATGGVDCRAAQDATFGTALGAFGSLPVAPIFAVTGDRNNTDIVQEQYRGTLGVRGDLPFIGSSWTFEVAGTYSRAEGTSRVTGIREDKLALSIGIDPTLDFDGDGIVDNNGDGIADDYDDNVQFGTGLVSQIVGNPASIAPCDASALANPDLAAPDLAAGCVPVNLFAPSLLGSAIGDFATQAERDYVFGVRDFDTTIEQTMLSAFVTGDLFELPAGPVGAVVGAEYRRDEINSVPNFVASNGLFFAFFNDSGAVGSSYLLEAFGEIDLPLIAGETLVEELNVGLAARVTEQEFYGTNFTYSLKGGWRPIAPLLLRVTYGTSFRAPNLRENFLAQQSGFNNVFDPCAVPDAAFDGATGTYDPTLDQREPQILANCLREGRDPTTTGLSTDPTTGQSLPPIQTTSAEIVSGGSLDIDPETSTSLTAGFSFEETIGDGFDVALGATYYDIQLSDSIIEPNAQFIVNDCFAREDGQRSPFCDRITVSQQGTQLISNIEQGFINLNREAVRGIDFNVTLGKEVTLFGTNIDFGLDVRANHLIERSTLFVDDDGVPAFDDDAGEPSLPRWTGIGTFTADVDDFRFTWEVRYTGPVEQDPIGIDAFSDAFGFGPDGTPAGVTSNTCLGGGSRDATGAPDGVVVGDGVFCRDVGFADEIFYHAASIRYRSGDFTLIAGVDNVFNTAPPQVDGSEVLSIGNTIIGAGYDYDGREFFASVQYAF